MFIAFLQHYAEHEYVNNVKDVNERAFLSLTRHDNPRKALGRSKGAAKSK